MVRMPAMLRALLALSILWASLGLAKDVPTMKVNEFDIPPSHINYFGDSDVVIVQHAPQNAIEGNVYRSEDAGFNWKRVNEVPVGKSLFLIMHKFDPKTAFILTASDTHYKTSDRGKTWTTFTTGALPSKFRLETLGFHATDPNRIIFHAMHCDGILCEEHTRYTLDGFKTTRKLRASTAGCWWAKSSDEFTTGDADLDMSRILCLVKPNLVNKLEQRLLISDTFFAIVDGALQESEPDVGAIRRPLNVIILAIVKNRILVVASSSHGEEATILITDNTRLWTNALFPEHRDSLYRIDYGSFTILDHTNSSIQIDAVTSQPPNSMGILLTSNSEGTYFTETVRYTNRNELGFVDLEQVSDIRGMFLVNVVENGPDIQKLGLGISKVVGSKLTFDGGRTFHNLKAGNERLHLHSVTTQSQVSGILSNGVTGFVMGNGNTGEFLGKPADAHFYVSKDAGQNWVKAFDGAHKYAFGASGSIFVAVRDSGLADVGEFSYSLDGGENWKSVALPENLIFKPEILTTESSKSYKFILGGRRYGAYYMVAINFEGIHDRLCGDEDIENWYAQVGEDGKPACVMGRKRAYRRPKRSASCLLRQEATSFAQEADACECSHADFECDYNFQRDFEDRNKCSMIEPVVVSYGECVQNPGRRFWSSSGWRLIPGNMCKRLGGKQKDDKVERECSKGAAADDKTSGKPLDLEFGLRSVQKFISGHSSRITQTTRRWFGWAW